MSPSSELKVVEAAFVIHLEKYAQERLPRFLANFGGMASLPEIQVWKAVHGDSCPSPDNWKAGNGAWGCFRSHQSLLEHCLQEGIGSYVVFEDDAIARSGVNWDEACRNVFENVPEDWEQLYLGGQLLHERSHPPVALNEFVVRPFNVNRTHCYAVSRQGMKKIYQHISQIPYAFHGPNDDQADHIDHHLGRLHEDMTTKVYAAAQWLVGQHGFSSNVSGRTEPASFFSDPIDQAKNHWLYRDPVCVLLRATADMRKACVGYLHCGNTINQFGYDVSLAEAVRLRNPNRAIADWYGWARGEVVQEGKHRLPCVFHPEINLETLQEALPGVKVIVLDRLSKALDGIPKIKAQVGDWEYVE